MTDALYQPERSHQPESPVQSVDRAVSILELLGRLEEAGVTDMAAALGVLGLGLIRLAGAATVRRTPLHATSSGNPAGPSARARAREQTRGATGELHTHTVTDPGTLRSQLKRARADGCAYSVEELEKGLNAVAAPVFTFNGEVMAALSASGRSFRLTEQRLPEVSAAVRAAAEKISERLGHFRRATP